MMKTNLNILYEDNHLIVVVKPRDILSQSDKTNDDTISNMIKEYLKIKYNKQGNVYLGLIQRLDRRVSGIMVFAKTSKAASRLSEQIRQLGMTKTYYAIVLGNTLESGQLVNYIKKINVNGNNLALITDNNDPKSKEAILTYKKIKNYTLDKQVFSLLEVSLITGRYNQIRASFSHINHPLINDFKYGYKFCNYNDELGLACVKLSFAHPITKEIMNFTYLPEGEMWLKFL